MIAVGGTNKFIVTYIQKIPQLFDIGNAFVNVSLGAYSLFLGFFLDFLTVFVGTCKIENVKTAHSLVTSDCVATNGGVAMP